MLLPSAANARIEPPFRSRRKMEKMVRNGSRRHAVL
jgi:hypothetical protein